MSYRLTELRSALLAMTQFLAWPVFFFLASMVSQEPAYFLALALVLAADLVESSPRSRALFRDSVAGGATAILALFLNDQDVLAFGAIVAVVAISGVVLKANRTRS